MTRTEVKAVISTVMSGILGKSVVVGNLMLQEQIDATTKEKTEWVDYWNNDLRCRVVAHNDVMVAIKAWEALPENAGKEFDRLVVKHESIAAEVKDGKTREAYTLFKIVIPANIVAVW